MALKVTIGNLSSRNGQVGVVPTESAAAPYFGEGTETDFSNLRVFRDKSTFVPIIYTLNLNDYFFDHECGLFKSYLQEDLSYGIITAEDVEYFKTALANYRNNHPEITPGYPFNHKNTGGLAYTQGPPVDQNYAYLKWFEFWIRRTYKLTPDPVIMYEYSK
jgi:hypothetical protein